MVHAVVMDGITLGRPTCGVPHCTLKAERRRWWWGYGNGGSVYICRKFWLWQLLRGWCSGYVEPWYLVSSFGFTFRSCWRGRGGWVWLQKLGIKLGLDTCSLATKISSKMWYGSTLRTVANSVLKSGPVRFFPNLGPNRNQNRLQCIPRVQKTEPDCTQPVACSPVGSKKPVSTGYGCTQLQPTTVGSNLYIVVQKNLNTIHRCIIVKKHPPCRCCMMSH